MAVTNQAAVQVSIPQLWAEDLFAEAENSTFWHNLEGPVGSSMPIQRRDDLSVAAGDTIKFDIVKALATFGQSGDSTLLEGSEEALKFRQTSMTVSSLQNAVRWSKLAAILNTHNLMNTAKNQLAKWLAEALDNRIFAEFTGMTVGNYAGTTTIPTSAQWFAGTATSIVTVSATVPATPGAASGGTLTLRDITEIKAYARVTPKIEPLRMQDGQEYFGMVCHPWTIMSLKRDDTQWAQAQRDAQLRGPDNPVFTGAVGMWDGVILYESNRVPIALDGASSNPVSRNVFFGAQALSRGYAYYPDWTTEGFSYNQEAGIATFVVVGQKLNTFDLTAAGGASAANFTAIGSMVLYASAAPAVA